MFEQDKTIMGQRTEYGLDLNNKEKELSKIKVEKQILEIYTIDGFYSIKEEDFDILLGDKYTKKLIKIKKARLVPISDSTLEDLIKKANISPKYISKIDDN